MKTRTCVSPEGRFCFGVHRPHFDVDNFRQHSALAELGLADDGSRPTNRTNFPEGRVTEPAADLIFEIPNALPFKGTTYINSAWADARAKAPLSINLPEPPSLSFSADHTDDRAARSAIEQLPRSLQLALAVTSTDARDLTGLAHIACTLAMDEASGQPWGLHYTACEGGVRPAVTDADLFEAVANNPHLPDAYKRAMVLRPGAQGASEIVGEMGGKSHVWEYLRRNSYIPWGHYAANMAEDAVRYRLADLSREDMTALRHLYYQRSYARLAELLHLPLPARGRPLESQELEDLRQAILVDLPAAEPLTFDRTLWGWNYGFDYAPSRYRLHASHQQIHQQYAMIPRQVPLADGDDQLACYACGDLVADFAETFREESGQGFFDCYEKAIYANTRTDGRPGEASLVVWQDDQVLLFVPKAQTSQWELQLMPKSNVGNIFEADAPLRRSLDRAIFTALRVLGRLGAAMVTSIEYSKAIGTAGCDQRLLMAFLPRLPESPGAFSEAQLRWINGHYPEDFAIACRAHLPEV